MKYLSDYSLIFCEVVPPEGSKSGNMEDICGVAEEASREDSMTGV
jgi:hypothetical protein